MCQRAGCYSARHGDMVAAQRLLSRFLPSAPLAARRAALPASPLLAAQALARPSSWESRARTGGTSSSSRLAAMLARSACPSPGWPRLAGPCVTVCVRASSGLGRRWGKARSGTPLQLLAAHSAVPPGPWGTCRKYIDLPCPSILKQRAAEQHRAERPHHCRSPSARARLPGRRRVSTQWDLLAPISSNCRADRARRGVLCQFSDLHTGAPTHVSPAFSVYINF